MPWTAAAYGTCDAAGSGTALPVGAGTGLVAEAGVAGAGATVLEAGGAVLAPMLPFIGRGDIIGRSCFAPCIMDPGIMEPLVPEPCIVEFAPIMPARWAPIAVAAERQTYRP